MPQKALHPVIKPDFRHTDERRQSQMALRPLLIGLTLILALVLIILSILLINPTRPLHESQGLVPSPSGANQQH
jgi:hypothetical protein